jgi:hypothetical protein
VVKSPPSPSRKTLAVIFMRPPTSTFIISIIVSLFVNCSSDNNGKSKHIKINDSVYNKNYLVDSVPSLQFFLTLNEDEKGIDSMSKSDEPLYKEIDSIAKLDKMIDINLMPYRNFSTNRSRIYFSSYKENDLELSDSSDLLKEGLATECGCITKNDTIFISMSFGYFGGGGFNINIFKSGFTSSYSQYIDQNLKLFKTKITDDFSDNFSVDNKFQFLILDKNPSLKKDEQLTGFLTFTTNCYFERKGDKLDTNYVKGHLYFTCKTK